MAVTAEILYSKFLQAREALGDYALTILDKVSTGNQRDKTIRQFNVMSAWISYMEGKLKITHAVNGKAPSGVVISNITALEGSPITIGIEDIVGVFVPIMSIDSFSVDNHLVALVKSFEKVSGKEGIYVKIVGESLVVSFPATSRFNGMSTIFSPTVLSHTVNPAKLKGGVDAVTLNQLTDQKVLKRFETALDHIAIHLNLTYKSAGEFGIGALEDTHRGVGSSARNATTALLVGLGKALVDGDGNTLEL